MIAIVLFKALSRFHVHRRRTSDNNPHYRLVRSRASSDSFRCLASHVTMADLEILAYGVSSTIYKKRNSNVVVKVGSFSVEPHDIRKELAVLKRAVHSNIIPLLEDDGEFGKDAIWMPYIPFSLEGILNSPFFSPNPFPQPTKTTLGPKRFTLLTRSFLFQLLSALAYLHKEGIGHRDIKPSNVLLTHQGWIRLIDFGVSYLPSIQEEDELLYPESSSDMYFQVCTGPYRPPELLFSPRSYDATKVDIWSMGCLIAECFTTLRLLDDDDDDDDQEQSERNTPFVLPPSPSENLKWFRDSLFNGSRGEIGLAWSIFRIRGTPTPSTWPEFRSLPSASSVEFILAPKVPLEPLLPNLPPAEDDREMFLRIIEGWLTYPPEQRMSVQEALEVILGEGGIILPTGYPQSDHDGEELERLVGQALNGI